MKQSGTRRALLVSVTINDDQLEVSLDDVVSTDADGKSWGKKEHVTRKVFAAKLLADMSFGEQELSDFGHYVFSRLSAYVARGEN